MSRLEHLIRFTALGAFALLVYFLDLSELTNAISNFVFFSCIAFLLILSMETGYIRLRTPDKILRQFIPEPDNSPKTRLLFLEARKKTLQKKGRYHAQDMFRDIGREGQALLGERCVAIVGLANPGASSAELLARAGLGHIRLIDDEAVGTYDIICSRYFSEPDLEKPRAEVLEDSLSRINSRIAVRGHMARINDGNHALLDSDLVMDFSMDHDTRSQLNAYCRKAGIPLLSMSISATRGRVMAAGGRGACLECQLEAFDEESGSPSVITGQMGSALITSLALRVLLKKTVSFDVLGFDSVSMELDKSVVEKRPGCAVCANED